MILHADPKNETMLLLVRLQLGKHMFIKHGIRHVVIHCIPVAGIRSHRRNARKILQPVELVEAKKLIGIIPAVEAAMEGMKQSAAVTIVPENASQGDAWLRQIIGIDGSITGIEERGHPGHNLKLAVGRPAAETRHRNAETIRPRLQAVEVGERILAEILHPDQGRIGERFTLYHNDIRLHGIFLGGN